MPRTKHVEVVVRTATQKGRQERLQVVSSTRKRLIGPVSAEKVEGQILKALGVSSAHTYLETYDSRCSMKMENGRDGMSCFTPALRLTDDEAADEPDVDAGAWPGCLASFDLVDAIEEGRQMSIKARYPDHGECVRCL